MNRDRWIAIAAFVLGLQLLFQGYLGFSGIAGAGFPFSSGPDFASFMTAEEIAQLRPLLGAMFAQGLLGAWAIVVAIGLLRRATWAQSGLLWGSSLLLISAVAVIALAPHQWDLQLAFACGPLVYIWERYAAKRRASAL